MHHSDTPAAELLKMVLASLQEPGLLDDHPWALSVKSSGRSAEKSQTQGMRLVDVVTGIFRKMIPPGPPKSGKRLDTRWGSFGILAAQYFAPYLMGKPFPTSLREAWESIDPSILYFVYNRTGGVSEGELARYRFAGNEIEPAPNSTLSDWHRRGIEQLAQMVELELQRQVDDPKTTRSKWIKRSAFAIGTLTAILLVFLGWKAWGLYQHLKSIEQKVEALETYLNPAPKLEQIPQISDQVHDLRAELDEFQIEVEPYLWLAPYTAWIPTYGGTLSQTGDLLALAGNLTTAADEGLTAIAPVIKASLTNDRPLEVMDLILQLQEASPQLLNAQVALAQAGAARERIDTGLLIPRIKSVLTSRIDPLFESISGAFPMEDALSMVRSAPQLLGSGKAGPQTYLILMQNEDELRPTGGFLTAAGSAVVKDGRLISIDIQSSDLVDDLSKAYPVPPWQFEQFMNIEMLLFRDSNWFTDFPTTASWAEYFYSYSRASSADGVIAMDMYVIARLLETLGPLRVEGVDLPITHENVLEYMRSAEEARPKGVKGEWDRKRFISRLAQPLLDKILEARGQTWTDLVPVMLELLDEKHILLQLDDEEATDLLERRNWDGAVRIPSNSDFLLAVDTNMGYNKTNALMEMGYEYQVDLADPAQPTGLLSVMQTNHSQSDLPCNRELTQKFIIETLRSTEIPEPIYNMDECYWGYLRVYMPSGSQLLDSNPREIPAEATMLGETIPARTDDLGDEDIPGAQVYGMMVITPTRDTTTTEFEYSLPPHVVSGDLNNKSWTYRLKVQKQPGSVAQSLKLTLYLPDGARIKNASVPFTENAGAWVAQLDLRRDLMIEVQFGMD